MTPLTPATNSYARKQGAIAEIRDWTCSVTTRCVTAAHTDGISISNMQPRNV